MICDLWPREVISWYLQIKWYEFGAFPVIFSFCFLKILAPLQFPVVLAVSQYLLFNGLYAFSSIQFGGQRGRSSGYNWLKCHHNTEYYIFIRLCISNWKKNISWFFFFLNVEKGNKYVKVGDGLLWSSYFEHSILVLRKLRVKVYHLCIIPRTFTVLESIFSILFL